MRSMRISPAPLIAAALLVPTLAAAQECPDGRPRAPTLGIGMFHCLGGRCGLDMSTPRGPAHDFSSEPRVWHLDPRGPSAGRLREGDVITSVDGALVTTPEGGHRLATLREGRAVRLGVRRGGEELEVSVVPETGCGAPGLIISSSPGKPRWPARVDAPRAGVGWGVDGRGPPLRFGMQLECGECGWRRDADGWVFHSATSMRVKSVDRGSPAERAGLRPGDVILGLHRGIFGDAGGAAAFRGLRPGRPIRLVYLRDGRTHSTRIVPQLLRPDEL
jgi:S1-C subfamily serine protease